MLLLLSLLTGGSPCSIGLTSLRYVLVESIHRRLQVSQVLLIFTRGHFFDFKNFLPEVGNRHRDEVSITRFILLLRLEELMFNCVELQPELLLCFP